MKRNIFTTMLALLACIASTQMSVAAQQTTTPQTTASPSTQQNSLPTQQGERRNRKANRLFPRPFRSLNLTDEQKAKLTPIFQERKQQTKATRADATLTEDAKKAKIKSINRTAQEQARQILTPEQRQTFTTARRQRRNNAAQ